MTVDYFNSDGKPCYLCSDDTAKDKETIAKVAPEKIMEIEDLTFLPRV